MNTETLLKEDRKNKIIRLRQSENRDTFKEDNTKSNKKTKISENRGSKNKINK